MASNTLPCPKDISLSATKYRYDGKIKKPSVIVKASNGKIISSSNYTLKYSSGRKNVGRYSVKIKFKGNYSGSVTKYFVIKPPATSLSKLYCKIKRIHGEMEKADRAGFRISDTVFNKQEFFRQGNKGDYKKFDCIGHI